MSFTFDFPTIAIIILSIAVVALIGVIIHLHSKVNRFLVGIDSKHIGDSLTHLRGTAATEEAFRKELEAYLETVERRLKRSVQAVHTVRFNPFKGTGNGGNQSFATAFLTEDGDGVILSSLYAREHVSVFSKPIMKHASEFELSQEEKDALEKAKIIMLG